MIQVEHLTKRYGGHTAVDDLTFRIEKGQIYGFLGPNGAGKSTTMNIITGCLAATSGRVIVGGHDIFEEPDEAKRLIGYLPEQPPVYPEMTPREYLRFVAKAKGLKGEQVKSETERVMRVTGITEMGDRLCRNLSKGYRQRVGLAQALLGDPEVIILDEPTVGLDPKQIIEIRELIQSLGERHTVILSSHILSEVQAVCGRILIISHGRLMADDTPENLEALFAGAAQVQLVLRAAPEQAETAVRAVEGVRIADSQALDGGRTRLTLENQGGECDELCERLFFACCEAKTPILSMTAAKASLEDVFLELTASDEPVTEAEEPQPEPAAQDEGEKEESEG